MVPKATVKVPLPPPQPTAAPTAALLVPESGVDADVEEPAADQVVLFLSIGALVVSLITLALAYLAYSA